MEEPRNESKNIKPDSIDNTSRQDSAQQITIPLHLFLQLLWGYKKGVELRDRAVPGQEIVEILRAQIPDLKEAGIYIEDKEDALSSVWQLAEWKSSGEKVILAKQASDKYVHNVELLAAAIFAKMPVLGMPFIRQLAHNVIHNNQWDSVKMFGLEKEQFKV